MTKRNKIIAAIIAVAVIALVAWTVLSIPQPPTGDQEKKNLTMSYDGNTISEEKNGRKIWEITAEHITVAVDTNDATFENVTGTFYQEDGRSLTVTAEKGNYVKKTNDIKLTGDIFIKTSDGATLKSDELDWSGAEEKLSAVGNAKVTKDDMRANGDRIESTNGFARFKIIGHAHIDKGVEGE